MKSDAHKIRFDIRDKENPNDQQAIVSVLMEFSHATKIKYFL